MGLFDFLGVHPILAVGLECALFAVIGSILSQLVFAKKNQRWDVSNMMSMASFSLLWYAPPAFYWYPLLESWYPGTENTSFIVYKLLLDQLLFSLYVLSSFWFHSTFVSTLNLQQSIAAVSNNLFASLLSNWCYWPFVQIINIMYVPVEYKILVLNIASIPWNMYCSYSVSQQNAKATSSPTKSPSKKKKKKKPKKDD
mmetsp:Transcript_58827/g.97331  ORF Transcript_58827/g.97331 Transcript_58827/m.97331 type:complete len:198 (-) Transcript_58827:30-623(-)